MLKLLDSRFQREALTVFHEIKNAIHPQGYAQHTMNSYLYLIYFAFQ